MPAPVRTTSIIKTFAVVHLHLDHQSRSPSIPDILSPVNARVSDATICHYTCVFLPSESVLVPLGFGTLHILSQCLRWRWAVCR